MPESKQHIDLVKRLLHHIEDNYSDKSLFVLSDLPEEHTDNRPPRVVNHVPDVFASNPITGFAIIGEAKILKDIETDHTINQLKEFINYLKYQEGESLLLLSVSLEGAFSAKRLLNSFHGTTGSSTKIFVLDGINVGGVF